MYEMPSHQRKLTRAIVNSSRNKKKIFYYKGSDFEILDSKRQSVYQDYQYVSMLWRNPSSQSEYSPDPNQDEQGEDHGDDHGDEQETNNAGYAGHHKLGGVVNFNRGNVVQGTWSVDIYSDKECLNKIGDISWIISAQITDPSKLFSEQTKYQRAKQSNFKKRQNLC